MLTAVIRAAGGAEALAATFAVLIPAVSEGFLGHAVVVDGGGDPDLERLADATGASYLHCGAEGWHLGAAEARGAWLLLLVAGEVPDPHWIAVTERHMAMAGGAPALMPLRGVAASLQERAAVSFGPRRLRPGLIAPRAAVLAGMLASAPRRLAVRRERIG